MMNSNIIKTQVIRILILAIIFSSSALGLFSSEKEIRVIADKTNLYLKADVKSPVIEILDKDTILSLLKTDKEIQNWFYVSFYSENHEIVLNGFIQASLVEIIQASPIIIKEDDKADEYVSPIENIVVLKEPLKEEKDETLPKVRKKKNNYIKIGVNYFKPSEQRFIDIYGKGLEYEGEITFRIWKRFGLWFGGGYFNKTGELTFTKAKTEVTIIPIGGGINFRILQGPFNLYTGIGLNYCQFKESNPIVDVTKGKLGYIGKIGSFIRVVGGLILDIHVDYSYCKINPAGFQIDIGGLKAGASLGFEF